MQGTHPVILRAPHPKPPKFDGLFSLHNVNSKEIPQSPLKHLLVFSLLRVLVNFDCGQKYNWSEFYVRVTVHRKNFFLIKPKDALFPQIYFVKKLYMFRSVPLPIIRSLFTVHSAMVYVIQVCRQLLAGAYAPAQQLSTNIYDIYHC